LQNSDYRSGEKGCDNRDNHIQQDAISYFAKNWKRTFRINPSRNSKTADPGLNNYGFTTLVPILLLEQKTRKNATCFSPDVNLEIEIVGSLVGTLGAGHIPGLVVDIVHVALEVVLLSEALVTRVAGEGLPLHLGVATAAAQLVLLHILHRLLALAAHNWLQRERYPQMYTNLGENLRKK
jgi:hypothetical protein